MANPLSARQRQTLEVIINRILETGYHPSQKEIAVTMATHPNVVGTSLIALEEKGYIARPYGRFKVLKGSDGRNVEIQTQLVYVDQGGE